MGGYDDAIQTCRRNVTRKSRPISIVLSGVKLQESTFQLNVMTKSLHSKNNSVNSLPFIGYVQS